MLELAIAIYLALWIVKLPMVLRGTVSFTYFFYRRKGQPATTFIYVVGLVASTILSLTGLFIMLWYEGIDFFHPYDDDILDTIAEDLLRGE